MDRYGLLVILGLFLFLPHAFSNTVGPVMNSMIEVIDFMTAGHWT